jgi:hypothetical protein
MVTLTVALLKPSRPMGPPAQGGPDLSGTPWDVEMKVGRIGCSEYVWAPPGVYNTMHTAPSLAKHKHNKHTTLPQRPLKGGSVPIANADDC